MTFLELCQAVARESGTIPGSGKPLTVIGQTGRLQRIVGWTNDAYRRIQTSSDDWRWLTTEFEASLIYGTQRYTAVSLGITTRFAHWVHRGERGAADFTIYATADGQATEGEVIYAPWRDFRNAFLRGSAASMAGKPGYWTVDDQDRIVVHPTPDVACTMRGLYYKAPQALAADGDIPEMPEQFHAAIQWAALVQLATFDEASEQIGMFESYRADIMADLRRKQLPEFRLCGALA